MTDSIALLEAQAQRAEDLWRRGEFAAALRVYTEALRARLLGSGLGVEPGVGLTAADMVVAERLADLAVLFGHGEAADLLLAGAAGRAGSAGNVLWSDYLLLKRVDLALGSGRLSEAHKLLCEMSPRTGELDEIEFSPAGLDAWEARCEWPGADGADRTQLFTQLYLAMGRVLASLGQYGNAVEVFARGVARASGEGAPDLARRALLPLRLALASAQLERGALADAAASLKGLGDGPTDARRPAQSVWRLELEGKLALLTGDFGVALERFVKVLNLCARHGFAAAAQTATLNLAHAQIYLNQTGAAKRMLQDLLAPSRAPGAEMNALRAEALIGLAEARQASLADAVSIAPSATELFGFAAPSRGGGGGAPVAGAAENLLDLPQSDNFLTFFEDRLLGWQWLLGRGDLRAAAAELERLKEIFADTDSLLVAARLRVADAALAYYARDYARAEESLGRALPLLGAAGLKPELWQAQRLLCWCMAKTGRSPGERERLAAETARLLDSMTSTLSKDERAVFLLNKWTAEEEYIAGEVSGLTRLKVELGEAPFWRRPLLRWRLWRRLAALLAYVDRYKGAVARAAARGGAPEAKREAPSASLAGRLWRGRRGHATISFLVLPDRVLVARAGRLSLDFGVSAATRLQVRDIVGRWHQIIRRAVFEDDADADLLWDEGGEEKGQAGAEVSGGWREAAKELADALQLDALLDGLPANTGALTIVPDDSLHGFPFAAVDYRGRYLVESFALSYALTHEPGEGAAAPKVAAGEALTVGVARGGDEFVPLPCVPVELERVGAWLGRRGMDVRRLDDAGDGGAGAPSKSALLGRLTRAAFAHIACHGVFSPDSPDESGLVVAPEPGRTEIVSVRELSALSLKGLRHVTLSSCWSADHFILPGRWVISLPETLCRVGVGSVLGCQWLVNDRVGLEFMTRFYDYLETLPRREALRRTQLDCLRGELTEVAGVDASHPIYWAGYQLYGDGGVLKL